MTLFAPGGEGRAARKAELGRFKRERILAAAREVFAENGLERATVRQIAGAAGYVAGTLYLHFDSKEAIYGALLRESLVRLDARIDRARAGGTRDALMSFYRYYAENDGELDLGLHLFHGTKRSGLTPELDQDLNDRLRRIVEKLAAIYAVATDIGQVPARRIVVSLIAFMVGSLILGGTGRLGMLGYAGDDLVSEYLDTLNV